MCVLILISVLAVVVQNCFAIPFEPSNVIETPQIGDDKNELKRSSSSSAVGKIEARQLQSIKMTVFDDFEQKGRPFSFILRSGECFKLGALWNGDVLSIEIPEGACVQLYDRLDCLGINLQLIGGERPDVERQIFANGVWNGVEAVKLC